jgi:glycogen phosphorylase
MSLNGHTDLHLPERIKRLGELAYNMWWSWNRDASALFRYLDKTRWELTQQNPVKLLRTLPPAKLEAAASDPAFLRRYDGVMLAFDRVLAKQGTWFPNKYPHLTDRTVAYFSAEFGVHNSLPIYSGGLGILAGDHCKEASDIGLPLVGVGFVYPEGYFHQRISAAGRQEAHYLQLDYSTTPIDPVFTKETSGPLRLDLDSRAIYVAVWRVRLGSAALYLMNADVEENQPWDRELSARLYGGDRQTRLLQEMLLGIGGVRMLKALNIEPTVFHANEGHAAFLLLERIRGLVAGGMSFEQAAEAVRSTSVFTTHTPVPAGHDTFAFNLIEKHFDGYWNSLGITREHFLSLGAHNDGHGGTNFNMTALALRLAGTYNGVSWLNGVVSRKMWHSLWPDKPEEQVPIGSVTNGVHSPTWVAPDLDRIFAKHLGRDWQARLDDPTLWERLNELPDEELWYTHQRLKNRLMSFMRERARLKWIADGTNATHTLASGTLFDPEALTIGFARRFATYKRALLIFRDMERLKKILQDSWRPVQLVFAGKAHPDDAPGRNLIYDIYNIARDHQMGGHVAFVEDYDILVAKRLYHGVDVWMNNPRPPLEASGTSGMKAALNGAPNLSVRDGWWYEGYHGTNGWAIGGEPMAAGVSDEERDAADAESLYRVLESEVVPLFYDRDSDGIPRGWVQVMKEAIRHAAPTFSARRMVKEYTERMYLPAMLAAEKK